jgi:hypothetical protein
MNGKKRVFVENSQKGRLLCISSSLPLGSFVSISQLGKKDPKRMNSTTWCFEKVEPDIASLFTCGQTREF